MIEIILRKIILNFFLKKVSCLGKFLHTTKICNNGVSFRNKTVDVTAILTSCKFLPRIKYIRSMQNLACQIVLHWLWKNYNSVSYIAIGFKYGFIPKSIQHKNVFFFQFSYHFTLFLTENIFYSQFPSKLSFGCVQSVYSNESDIADCGHRRMMRLGMKSSMGSLLRHIFQ